MRDLSASNNSTRKDGQGVSTRRSKHGGRGDDGGADEIDLAIESVKCLHDQDQTPSGT
jgi:hypothetical protein